MKEVRYSNDARKSLKVHGNIARRRMKVILDYAQDQSAHANMVTKLVGSSGKRMRVGDFRIIFEEDPTTILVTKLGPRRSIYEGM